MLTGEKNQLYLHEGSNFATPSEQYADWGNINYTSMRDQNLPPSYEQYVDWGINVNLSS
jgi:hypothetical protein